MEKRTLVLAAFGLIATLGCSDDPATGAGGAAGMSTAGGMAVTGTSGTGAAGSGASGTGAAAAGTGIGASGTGAAGAAAGAGASGTGAAGSTAAGSGASGMGAAGAAAGSGASGMGGMAGGAAGAEAGTGGAAGGGGGTFTLTSSVVQNGQMLPAKHRCESSVGSPTGPNPPFEWSGAPAGTMSFALIMRDRTFNNYQHWTIYDIPASTTSLPEGGVPTGAMPAMPAGAKQVRNSPGLPGPGYYGPCGQTVNTYEFKLYALDVATLPMAGMTGASVEMALEMHDLATASLMVMSGP